jgi:predicted DNA-binding protein
MKRTNLFIPEQTLERLKALSDRMGLPMSELIRRAIDAYLKKHDKEK